MQCKRRPPAASDVMAGLISGYDVVESSVTVAAGATLQFLQRDASRWAFVVSFSSVGLIGINQANQAAGNGLLIGGTNGIFTFNARDHAALVQTEWFVNSAVGGVLTVLEVTKL